MTKYIPAEKLITEIDRKEIGCNTDGKHTAEYNTCRKILHIITSLQQEQPANMIQWTGSNLQEVIDFTGKSPKFGEWFKSWDEFESYVHSHGDILKLFSKDGSHFEVPVGAWIVKTPDGYNVASVARFIHAKQEQPEVDCPKIKGWVARGCDGLTVFSYRPEKGKDGYYIGLVVGVIDDSFAPEMTREDEPIEVELIIREAK